MRLPNIVIARPSRIMGLHHNGPRRDNMLDNIHGFKMSKLPKIYSFSIQTK